MASWHSGDVAKAQVTFTVGGAATDPTTVTLTVITPAGVSTSYTYAEAAVTKSDTGVYYKNVAITAAGTWHFKFTGTGTCAAVEETSIFVKPSRT